MLFIRALDPGPRSCGEARFAELHASAPPTGSGVAGKVRAPNCPISDEHSERARVTVSKEQLHQTLCLTQPRSVLIRLRHYHLLQDSS